MSLTWQALQNYEIHAENAQWAFLCCFLSQALLFHSLVLCISELTSFYQIPAPCGISQPAGHRHVVLTQPHPASPESHRTTPGSFAPHRLKGPGCIACYREDCENKPVKHGSDVGIYTGAAPQCLIPFNRGSKEVMWNGNSFFIYIFIPFSHFLYPNAHNCEITSPAGTFWLAGL